MIRRNLVLAAMAAAVTLSACGSAGAGSGRDVASLGTTPTTTAGSTPAGGQTGDQPSTDPQQAMLDYTNCMRDRGIDMPDPQFSTAAGSGGVVAREEASPGKGPSATAPDFDPLGEQFKLADEACKPLLAAAVNDVEIDPEQQAEMRKQMLAFSQCMRDHGIDFPDPVFSDDGSVSINIGSDGAGPQPDDTAFQDAQAACAPEGGPMVGTKAVGA